MPKVRTSLIVIGIVLAMLAASVLTVLLLFMTGVISANKPELEFTVNAVEEKEYDGTPLRATGFSWTSGSSQLKEGHRVEGLILGSQTDYGTSESDLRVTIYDAKGRDVTSEYSIKVNNCELKVTQRKISVIWGEQKLPYSGDELLVENYRIAEGTDETELFFTDILALPDKDLVEGHKLAISFPGFKNVGDKLPDTKEWSGDNFRIYNEVGQLVSRNYRIGWFPIGNIEIVPRKLGVKAISVEKYYDGTPIGVAYQHVWGSLIGNDFIQDVQLVDAFNQNVNASNIIKSEDSKSQVKISKLVLYKQSGFNTVPLSAEEQNNYEFVDVSESEYVSLTIRKRTLEVQTADLIKEYDGFALSHLVGEEPAYTVSGLPKGFTLTAKPKNIDTLVDVYDGTYSVGDFKVSYAGDDVSDQFEINVRSGIARITPIKINSYLNPFKGTYSGQEIEIPVGQVGQSLEANISKYLADHAGLQPSLQTAFETLKDIGTHFSVVSAVAIKNAGDYYFTLELNEEGAKQLNSSGNVIFSFNSAKATIGKLTLSATYLGSNGEKVTADNPIKMTYNGEEAKPELSKFVLEGAENFAVSAASFTYTSGNALSISGKHTLVGAHTANISGIHIEYNSEGALEDVTQNCIVITDKVYVNILPAPLYATSNQSYVLYEVTSVPDRMALLEIGNSYWDKFRYSIDFAGRAKGDSVKYCEAYYGFTLDFTANDINNIISYYVTYEEDLLKQNLSERMWIVNSDGEDVTSCYELVNDDDEDYPLITVQVIVTG